MGVNNSTWIGFVLLAYSRLQISENRKMGSQNNSPSLLSPRRYFRGYRSLSTNWEDSTDINNTSVTHGRSRNSRNTIQCATSLLYDIVSPKCSPLVRRVHISRLRQLLGSRETTVVSDDQDGLKRSKPNGDRSSSTSSMESLDCSSRPNGTKHLIGKTSDHSRTLSPHTLSLPVRSVTRDQTNPDSSKQMQPTFVRNLFQKAFKRNRRKNNDGGTRNISQKTDNYSPSKQPSGKLSDQDSMKSVHIAHVFGDAQSAPCSPLADVRSWYWRQVERPNPPTSVTCKEKECQYPPTHSDLCAVHTTRDRSVCSDIQSNEPAFLGSTQSPCTVLIGDLIRSRGTSNQCNRISLVRHASGCTLIQPTEDDSTDQSKKNQVDALQIFDPNLRISPSAVRDISHAVNSVSHRYSVNRGHGKSGSHEATVFTLPRSTTPYVLTADNRIARLSAFEAEVFSTSPATVLHNDLRPTEDVNRTDKSKEINSKEVAHEVTLQRCFPHQRFGMKLDRTDSPEKITYIAMILPESPASLAGLHVGDQVLRVNQTDVNQVALDDLLDRIRSADKSLHVVYQKRRTSVMTKTLIIRKQCGKIGIRLRTEASVLVVDVVLAGSPAASVGLRAGQRLLSINGQSVLGWDQQEAMNWLRTYPNDTELAVTVSDSTEIPQNISKDASDSISIDSTGTDSVRYVIPSTISREAFGREPCETTSPDQKRCPCQLLKPRSPNAVGSSQEEYEPLRICRPLAVLLECSHFANRSTPMSDDACGTLDSHDKDQPNSLQVTSEHQCNLPCGPNSVHCICPLQRRGDRHSPVGSVYCTIGKQQSERHQFFPTGSVMLTETHACQTEEVGQPTPNTDNNPDSVARTSLEYV